MTSLVDNFLADTYGIEVEKEDGELKHYGVKGMKWGVRKEVELSPEQKRAKAEKDAARQVKREARAQRYVKRANAFQKQIDLIDSKAYPNRFVKRRAMKNRQELVEWKKEALADAERKRQGKLSALQKKLLIGGAIVGGLIATKVVYDSAQSGGARRLIEKGKLALAGKSIEDAFNKNPALADPNMSIEDIQKLVQKPINPDFGKFGTTMNCRRTTMAYELRRRGMDVMATRTSNANGQNAMGLLNVMSPDEKLRPTGTAASVFTAIKESVKEKNGEGPSRVLAIMKNAPGGGRRSINIQGGANPAAIFEMLALQPNRSRGELAVQWGMGGGHSMAYEVINGAAVIIDNQTGQIFRNADELLKDTPGIAKAGFSRLDDLDMNLDYLLKWVRNVGRK